MPIDEQEAFWAMFCFLNHQAERTEHLEALDSVLNALRAELFDHSGPADRPLWDDWLASARAVRGSATPDTAAPDTDVSESTYSIVRYASIADKPASDGLAWVVLTHWHFEGGQEEWYTEYWDDLRNEEAPEQLHASRDQAVMHAEKQFGALDWLPGGPPHWP